MDWDDVVRLGRGGFDGRAAQSAEPLLLQQQLPHVAPVPARLQERGEDLAGGRGQALAPVAEVQLGHPPLEHLRVFGILVDDAVAALGPQAQVPPLHRASRPSAGAPAPAALPGPRARPRTRSARARSLRATASTPGRGARWTPADRRDSWAGPAPRRRRRTRRRRCGRRRRDRGRCSRPRAAAPGDALALPVLGADRVEVRVDLLAGQTKQLGELAHHAEPILPLLEGALQNFGAPEELVGHVPQHAQAPVERHLGLDPIVHHLHGLLRDGPVPRGVVGVGLLGDLHDHGAVFGIAHLAQSGGDDVAVRLHLAQLSRSGAPARPASRAGGSPARRAGRSGAARGSAPACEPGNRSTCLGRSSSPAWSPCSCRPAAGCAPASWCRPGGRCSRWGRRARAAGSR